MYTQTLYKKATLQPNWREDNYKGYLDYVTSVSKLSKMISDLIVSDAVDVESLDIEFTVRLKEKEKSEPKASLGLSDAFWLDVALGKYNS